MAGYIGSKASVTQVDGYNRTEADSEFVNDPNEVITVSGSNVGIGTSSPSSPFHVNGGGTNAVAAFESTDPVASVKFVDSDQTQTVFVGAKGDDFYIQAGGNEKVRVTSSGNVDITGNVTANQFIGGGTIIAVGSPSDGTNYSTESINYQTATRFQITPTTSTSRLLGWFFCQMRAVGSSADGDLGNTARVHYLNSSGSWVAISNLAQNLRTENSNSTGLQEIAVTFPVNLFPSHVNVNGVWDIAIRHNEVYDATSHIDDGRLHYMEYEP